VPGGRPQSAIAGETGFLRGLLLAIQINLARTVMDQMSQDRDVERSVMGVPCHDARQEDADAVGLTKITGSWLTAHERRLTREDSRIQPGDGIIAWMDQPVDNTPQLQQRVRLQEDGAKQVDVTVLRQGGEKKNLTVRAGRAPGEATSAVADGIAKVPRATRRARRRCSAFSVEPPHAGDARDVRLRAVARAGAAGLGVRTSPRRGPPTSAGRRATIPRPQTSSSR